MDSRRDCIAARSSRSLGVPMRRRSDIARVVAARFISRAGAEAAFFVGVWGKAAYHLHATPGQLAAVMFAMAVSNMVGSVVAGVLIDRHGPRNVLMLAEIVFVPATIAIAFAATLPALVGLVTISAFVTAFVMTASASFAPFLATETSELERINSRVEAAGSAAFVIGPAIAALIARYFDLGWVFAFDAATSLVGAALVVRVALVRQPKREAPTRGHALAETFEGMRVAYGSRPLRYYVLAGTVVWMSFGAFGALEPLFFRDVVHTGVESIGWINSLFGLALATGAWLLPKLPRPVVSARGLAVLVAACGLGASAYVGSGDLRLVALGAAGWGVIIGMLEPLLRTLMQRDTPHELQGRVTGTAQVHRHGGELLPLAVAPALAARFGVQATMIGGGLVATVVALLSLGEAAGIDRQLAALGPRDVHLQTLRTTDEPISPNP
ncbi:MAG: hypothetical protein C0418_05920 [Coriobacteriaceae bacterium]|nr:hypothetical protein [Coriobacteriaceae bacterium]